MKKLFNYVMMSFPLSYDSSPYYKAQSKMGTGASSNANNLSSHYSLPGGNETIYNGYGEKHFSRNFRERSHNISPHNGRGPMKADHNLRTLVKEKDYRQPKSVSHSSLRKSHSISDLRDDTESPSQRHRLSFLSKISPDFLKSRNSESRKGDDILQSAKEKLYQLSKSKKQSQSTSDISQLTDQFSKNNLSRTSSIKSNKKYTNGDIDSSHRMRRSSLSSDFHLPSCETNGHSTIYSESIYQKSQKSPAKTIPGQAKRYNSGLVGFRNLGNTCFMNCILQCLCRTKVLREYFLRSNEVAIPSKARLAKVFSELVKDVWYNEEGETISPSALKLQVQRYASRFSGTNQQDAQEFLRFFLEGIHEDLNSVTKKPTYAELKDESLSDVERGEIYWKRYLSRENSFFQDLFVGQLKSILTCMTCDHRSVTYDPFWDLSLPIPTKFRGDDAHITQCFAAFTQEEMLDGDEKPTCDKCKKRRRCSKRFLIERFPKILVIHLKRFSGMRYRRKLETKVDFPLLLDLKDFSSSRDPRQSTYSLYGVSNHMGGTHGGHYTAFCKHPDLKKWHCFNDTRVNEITPSRVVSPSAYVLFYEKATKSSFT